MLLSTLGEVIGVYRISLMIKVAPNPSFKISRFRARRGNGGGGGKNVRGGNGGGSGTIESKGKDGKGKDGKGNECDGERDDCERCFELSVSFYIQRKRLQRKSPNARARPSSRLQTPFPGGWGNDPGIDYQSMEETFFSMDCHASSTTIDLAGATEMMEEAERVHAEMKRVLAERVMAKGSMARSDEDINDWNACGLAVPSLIFFLSMPVPPARCSCQPFRPPRIFRGDGREGACGACIHQQE